MMNVYMLLRFSTSLLKIHLSLLRIHLTCSNSHPDGRHDRCSLQLVNLIVYFKFMSYVKCCHTEGIKGVNIVCPVGVYVEQV